MENRVAYGIDLWETSSEKFSIKNEFTNKLLGTNKFDIINLKKLEKRENENDIGFYYKGNKIELKAGDLVYRKGNVEFYIGNNKVVGWGRVHKSFTINKAFSLKVDGYYSSDIEDKNIPFITIIRCKGE